MKSILIKDTTREERIRIVTQSLQVCGQTCELSGRRYGGQLFPAVYQRRKGDRRVKRRLSQRFGEVSAW